MCANYTPVTRVDELDQEKLAPLLRLRYRALSDAFDELGKPQQVRGLFLGSQRHLYLSLRDFGTEL
jgi:hypothetical protein